MKKIVVLTLVLGAMLTSCSTGAKQLKTEIDSLSYSFAVTEIGPYVKMVDTTYHMNTEIILQAVRDVLADKAKMTPEEAQAFAQEYFTVRVPANNLKEAEAFLAETEAKAGVMKTESGLLYEILEEGGEKAANDTDTVVVLYTGMLVDGTVFDSTANRNDEPATFPLNGVIDAWTEGMKLVGKGGKIKLYAPPALAYGTAGSGQIRPNQALIFEIEVLDVKPAAAE